MIGKTNGNNWKKCITSIKKGDGRWIIQKLSVLSLIPQKHASKPKIDVFEIIPISFFLFTINSTIEFFAILIYGGRCGLIK